MEDLEDDDIESSYHCNLFVGGNPPHVMAIGIMYPGGSTMYIVSM